MIMSKIKDFFKKNWAFITIVALLTISCFMLYYAYKHEKKIRERLEQIDVVDSNNVFNRQYYEQEISWLKDKNKKLYDSIYAYKDKVSYLLQFKYEKEYDTGKVDTHKKDTTGVAVCDSIKEFNYANNLNDTMNYNLTVASRTEPEWYRLRVKMSEEFTIINKDEGNGQNSISIGGSGQGTISDVTTFKKKEKTSIWDRIAIGPTISAGYDPVGKRFSTTVGVGITLNLRSKKDKD